MMTMLLRIGGEYTELLKLGISFMSAPCLCILQTGQDLLIIE